MITVTITATLFMVTSASVPPASALWFLSDLHLLANVYRFPIFIRLVVHSAIPLRVVSTWQVIMQAVGVYERVEVAKSRGYSLRCPGSRVPANDKNTATRAAAAFFHATGLLAGCDITVYKAVPMRAGLAGGSADAAAVLAGLNELYGARLTLAQLCEIGLSIGADVPFSLLGGTARAGGIGEVLTPLAPLPPCWFAIAMPPGGGVSTPAAYQRFDEMGSPLRPSIATACAAVEAGDLAALCPHMQNMLEHANGDETTSRLRGVMDEHGALASLMTGSGAAVFGLFHKEAQARAAAQAARPLAAKTFCVPPVQSGVQVVGRY